MMRMLTFLAAFTMASAASAQPGAFTPGSYVTPDGFYTIQVQADGTNLTIVEPNRTSAYAPAGVGVYHFTHPNGTTYGIRVVDARTLESFKPGSGAAPTRLSLREQPEPGVIGTDESERYLALALQYQQRAEADSDNAHVWTACAAAAMTRSTLMEAGYREYTTQLVQMLKPIMTSPAQTPCEDAIPDALWRSVP